MSRSVPNSTSCLVCVLNRQRMHTTSTSRFKLGACTTLEYTLCFSVLEINFQFEKSRQSTLPSKRLGRPGFPVQGSLDFYFKFASTRSLPTTANPALFTPPTKVFFAYHRPHIRSALVNSLGASLEHLAHDWCNDRLETHQCAE